MCYTIVSFKAFVSVAFKYKTATNAKELYYFVILLLWTTARNELKLYISFKCCPEQISHNKTKSGLGKGGDSGLEKLEECM